MNVRVLYFASARDFAFKPGETLIVPDGSTLGDLADEVFRLHPRLKRVKNSVKFSVNFEIGGDDASLKDGDEIGVLPPVAGG